VLSKRHQQTTFQHTSFKQPLTNEKLGKATFFNHGLRGSARPVLTATGFVNGRWQFSTPYRINTPRPITKKFGTGDYVGGPYGCAKFGASMGGFWANG